MSHDQILKKMIAGALLSGGVAVAGLGLPAGTAQAAPPAHQWCPGQRMPDDGTNPDGTPHLFSWDMSVCHTYYIVGYKQGNVGDYIWADAGPPPPPARNPLCLPGPGCAPWP